MKKFLINLLKGVAIGVGMMVPGFGGGTTAIVLGIYKDIVSAAAGIFKPSKEKYLFLISVGIGAVGGIVALSSIMLTLINMWTVPMMYLFIGAMIGSLPILIAQSKIKKLTVGGVFWALLGIAIVVSIGFIPEGTFSAGNLSGLLGYGVILLAGIIVALALVLPGISASYMLLVLGMYETTLAAIHDRNLIYIAILAIGVVGGSFALAKILEVAMDRHSGPTFLIIIGFLLGSAKDVFPGIPTGWDILFSILTFILGAVAVYFITKKSAALEADFKKD